MHLAKPVICFREVINISMASLQLTICSCHVYRLFCRLWYQRI